MTWHPSSDRGDGSARPLREAIDRYLNRGGHGEIALLAAVVEVWVETVGTHVANHVQPRGITDDTLLVDVDQPAWSTEVTFLAEHILSGLRARLGEHVATFIKARVRGRSDVE